MCTCISIPLFPFHPLSFIHRVSILFISSSRMKGINILSLKPNLFLLYQPFTSSYQLLRHLYKFLWNINIINFSFTKGAFCNSISSSPVSEIFKCVVTLFFPLSWWCLLLWFLYHSHRLIQTNIKSVVYLLLNCNWFKMCIQISVLRLYH